MRKDKNQPRRLLALILAAIMVMAHGGVQAVSFAASPTADVLDPTSSVVGGPETGEMNDTQTDKTDPVWDNESEEEPEKPDNSLPGAEEAPEEPDSGLPEAEEDPEKPDSGLLVIDDTGKDTAGPDAEGEIVVDEVISEYHVKLTSNGWIEIEKGNTFDYDEETEILTATWKVADGGKFTSAMIEGSTGESVTLTEPKEFTFGGEECSLTESSGTYTLKILKPQTDLTITVNGESATPPQKITVNAKCNEWIIMDQDSGLTVEGSDATAVWTVKDGGALTEIIISNSTDTVTVLGSGEFEFGGQRCTLELADGVYTLRLFGLTEDTELEIYGETQLQPVKVTVNANDCIQQHDREVVP